MSEETNKALAEASPELIAAVVAALKEQGVVAPKADTSALTETPPEGGRFRYLGAVVLGEKVDDNGNTVPDISTSIEAYGHTFHSKRYTEVPGDQVAYIARPFNKMTGKREPKPVYVVEKLRGNKEFEEQDENAA